MPDSSNPGTMGWPLIPLGGLVPIMVRSADANVDSLPVIEVDPSIGSVRFVRADRDLRPYLSISPFLQSIFGQAADPTTPRTDITDFTVMPAGFSFFGNRDEFEVTSAVVTSPYTATTAPQFTYTKKTRPAHFSMVWLIRIL